MTSTALTFQYDSDDGTRDKDGTDGTGARKSSPLLTATRSSDSSPSSLSDSDSNNGDSHNSDEEEDEDEDDEEEEPPTTQVPVELPAWACRFCGIADPNCCARVLESGWWFCNSSGGTTGSHIIHHMVRSRSKELCLHPDSALGETIMECYNCSSRNLFSLGFLPKGDGVVVLLCRNCLGIGALKEEWDSDQWTPLVKDRALVPWLVKVPEPQLEERARHVTTAQIDRLEALWKTNPNATLEDLERPGVEDEPSPVLLRYDDGFHFQNVFGPLVQIEADYDRDMKEALREDNVSIKWNERPSASADKWISADVFFSPGASESMRLTIGDELQIRLSRRLLAPSRNNKADWETKATVVVVGEPGHPTTVEILASSRPPMDTTEGFSVAFVWKPITFDRMQFAMKNFAVSQHAVSTFLYHKILGRDVFSEETQVLPPSNKPLSAPGLPALNPSQQQAVTQVLPRKLALIQGPPGTGKTVTMATLVYHMVQAHQAGGSKKQRGQVLVCAPSNVAVDHVAEKIAQTGVKVVRLSAKSREHVSSQIEHLTLHNIISQLNKTNGKHRRRLERDVLRAADVVCCTCSGAGDPRLEGMTFRRVLIDEATQATEPETIIPIVLGCEQLVLVGDHCQLGPVVMSKKAANAGLNSSMFERLVTLGLRPMRLQVQYRMHPCLSEWPSNTFYEGSLQNGVTPGDRSSQGVDFCWIDPARPMMFMVCQGTEEIAATGTSFLNRAEATACEKVVTALLKGGVQPAEVGVITPYEGQRAFILTQLQRLGSLPSAVYAQVEVSSVDAFQGREKEYIIVSCVRSNDKTGIGFLNDPRRLNVALTRAKRGLILLGNPRVLAKRPLWNDLLTHFRERQLLVEGPLNNLQVSLMRFPPAKKYFRDFRQRQLEESMRPVFSGDAANPYAAPKLGLGLGDFDYGGVDALQGPLAGLHLHTQLSQSTQHGGAAALSAPNLGPGPVTQQSQRSQLSQGGG